MPENEPKIISRGFTATNLADVVEHRLVIPNEKPRDCGKTSPPGLFFQVEKDPLLVAPIAKLWSATQAVRKGLGLTNCFVVIFTVTPDNFPCLSGKVYRAEFPNDPLSQLKSSIPLYESDRAASKIPPLNTDPCNYEYHPVRSFAELGNGKLTIQIERLDTPALIMLECTIEQGNPNGEFTSSTYAELLKQYPPTN